MGSVSREGKSNFIDLTVNVTWSTTIGGEIQDLHNSVAAQLLKLLKIRKTIFWRGQRHVFNVRTKAHLKRESLPNLIHKR